MKRVAFILMPILLLCSTFLGIAFLKLSRSQPAAFGPSDLAELSFRPHPGTRLPLTESLVDEDGRSVSLGTYFTKVPVILVLEYLRCTSLCGVTLRNLIGDTLHGIPLQPGRDYQLVAVSIDPRDRPHDAASALKTYAALLDRSTDTSGLHFLTGRSASVRSIAEAVGFPYRYDSLLDAYIHPAGFIIAAPDGVISRYLEGFSASPQQIIGAISDAEQDKSQGPLTRLLLLCHIQGAPLGRWTIPIMAAFTIANLAAGFTVMAIFIAIKRRRYG